MPEIVQLNEYARTLLTDGEVDVVLGYVPGRRALSATPCQVDSPAQADRLIFDRTCEYNLANYLHRLRGRTVAIVAKGCDERSIVGLIQEKQLDRENVHIIGAPCRGVVSRHKVERAIGSTSITAAEVDGTQVRVTARGQEHTLELDKVIYDFCHQCNERNPRFADAVIGEEVDQPDVEEFSPEVGQVEQADGDAKWQRFACEMDKCILCMACRNVCPACYCTACFADETNPRWMSKTNDPADAMMFHLTRLTHLTGRCTGCGACVRACPVEVDLRLYNDKLRKDVKDLFEGFEAGIDPAAVPPLGRFCLDDRDDIFQ